MHSIKALLKNNCNKLSEMENEGVQIISAEAVIRKFSITLDQLVSVVENYRNRKFDEDITVLKHKHEGIDGLWDRLKTSIKGGIDVMTLQDREDDFGSNKKDPQKISGFWYLFFSAMNDFMLKILIVAAIISITIFWKRLNLLKLMVKFYFIKLY